MIRVLPRDAFNDANLLKCIGMITLLAGDSICHGLTFDYDGDAFDIQSDIDGNTSVVNISFYTKNGKDVAFYRPLNSRDSFPLYCLDNNEDEIKVFDDNGKLSRAFISFLQNN